MRVQFTIEERHLMYIILKAESEHLDFNGYKELDYGMCELIGDTFNMNDQGFIYDRSFDRYQDVYFDMIENFFPELWAKKPPPKHEFGLLWFAPTKEGWAKRINLFDQCIKETYE